MKRNRYVLLLFAIILSASFASCISVDRKIRINKDGSGLEEMKITFQKTFYDMMGSLSSMMDSTRRQAYLDSLYSDEAFMEKTKGSYDSIPGIKIIDITSEKGADSSNSFTVKYEFDSVSKIGSALTTLNEDEKDSRTTVMWMEDGGDIIFDYTYEQKNDVEMEGLEMTNDSLAEQMKKGFAEMFAGGNISIEIEFPYEVISSNAASSSGNVLRWSYSMPDIMMSSRMNLQARMKE